MFITVALDKIKTLFNLSHIQRIINTSALLDDAEEIWNGTLQNVGLLYFISCNWKCHWKVYETAKAIINQRKRYEHQSSDKNRQD